MECYKVKVVKKTFILTEEEMGVLMFLIGRSSGSNRLSMTFGDLSSKQDEALSAIFRQYKDEGHYDH